MSCLPSVMATAIMLHVVNSEDPCLEVEDLSQLLDVLNVQKVGLHLPLAHIHIATNALLCLIDLVSEPEADPICIDSRCE